MGFMSAGGVTVGDQWVQGIMNGPGPRGTGNMWVQRTTSSGTCFSGVISGSEAIGYYLLSLCGV